MLSGHHEQELFQMADSFEAMHFSVMAIVPSHSPTFGSVHSYDCQPLSDRTPTS